MFEILRRCAEGEVRLFQDPGDGGAADAEGLGDLAEALAVSPVTQDGFAVEFERGTSDVSAFETGATHAGANPFDDQRPLQFGDSADDDDESAAERTTGVDVLPKRYELDAEMVEFVEDLDEMADRARQAIEGPHYKDVELAAAGVGQELVEAGAPRLGTRDFVGVLTNDLKAALSDERTQIVKLAFWMLIDCGDPHVEGGAPH